MKLQIMLPGDMLLEAVDVRRIVAETVSGSFGILPHRLDCAAGLVPGVLTWEDHQGAVHHLAVDDGILVKAGEQVTVAVRHAVAGQELASLHTSVAEMLSGLDEQEREARMVLARLESGFIRQFRNLGHG